jgi:hypothetical protein
LLLRKPARVCVKLARFPSAADLPMSVVNCCLIFVEGSTDKAVRVASRELGRYHSRI